MWAASPTRNRRPKRIGSATKERSGAIDFSKDGPVVTRLGRLRRQAAAQLVPEALVGPVLDPVVERALHVVAAAVRRAHRAERKAASMIGIDQLAVGRRHLGQHAQPAERIAAARRS